MRRDAKPAKPKAKAARPVARTPQKTDGSRTRELEKRLAEALEQQAATSEILRVIGSSPTDLQPVFDAIVESAARLCDARFTALYRYDGDLVHVAAHHNLTPEVLAVLQRLYPMRPTHEQASGRAIMGAAVVHLPDVLADPEYRHEVAIAGGWASLLAVPMIREGRAVGTINIYRGQAEPFPENQIKLLKTFADQAVIAIENVRLFKELEARNVDLTEALEQQTATSEILRVISSSPTDLQPVLDTVVKSAARFCGAYDAQMWHLDGGSLRLAAHHGPIPSPVGHLFPVARDTVTGRTVLERRAVHVSDLQAETEEFPEGSARARETGSRTALSVPMLREGTAIGTIHLRRLEVNPFSDKQIALLQTFADQAVIAIENVRLFKELEARNTDLTEALEQQTATSEILRVISRSQTDVQPVFDTIVRSAVRLCNGLFSALFRFDGELIHNVAQHNHTPEALEAVHRVYPARLSRALMPARAILERAVVHIPDVKLDPEFQHHALSRAVGFRSGLYVPMLRDGNPIGVIVVNRAEAGPFSDSEIELLKTFADQAVIAIENVRLFKELEARNTELTESLEQQTATAEILRVISSSPTDLQPVLDAVAENAARLCDAEDVSILEADGEVFRVAAFRGASHLRDFEGAPVTRGSVAGRVMLDGQLIHVHDITEESDSEYPISKAFGQQIGHRTMLATPLLREGSPIGVIFVRRTEVRPFSERQITLLQTFADQAVIAVENVRLFKELQARNRDLTEALDQQTATSEILRVISQSQTDVQPVFDTIVRSAVRLCAGLFGALYRFDGELVHSVARHNYTPEALEEVHRVYPTRPSRALGSGRAILDGAVVHIPDVELDPEFQHRALSRATGWRSGLFVPMLREGMAIGAIAVLRSEPGPFPDSEIELLKTFADQAVIAIENVRLFKELEARNHDLTEALDQQTATAEILRVISSSPTDLQPVFDTIAQSALRLCDARTAGVVHRADETLHLVAYANVTPAWVDLARQSYPQPISRDRVGGLAILERRVVHVPDIHTDDRFPRARRLAQAMGYRSVVFVPMLREGTAIGAVSLSGVEPFSDKQIALLQTFADQAVIAIENVRLFKELEARNAELTTALDQQTATSEILRTISSSPTDVQPVFQTILDNAKRLLGAFSAMVVQRTGDELHLAALSSVSAAGDARVRQVFPIPIGEPSAAPPIITPILSRQPFVISDTETQPDEVTREIARARGYRSQLVVPLLREHTAIGIISVTRREAGGFTQDEVALLQTFADQAVIAIENVRLFKELEARNHELTETLEQQTATGEILRVISRSQTNVQPVFDTIVRSAVKLCDGLFSALYQFDGELLHQVAQHNFTPEALEAVRRISPVRPTRALGGGRAILERTVVHIPDVEVDPEYPDKAVSRAIGFRSGLFVPMLREGAPIGVIMVARAEAGPFSDSEIELLKTFADQAVIAVENVRLFKALEARTGELTQSVEKLTALGEVSRAVSSTLDVETVLDTIVSRASQLAGAAGCSIYEYDEAAQQFELRATHNDDAEFVGALRAVPLRKGEGLMGRAAEMREPMQIPDITQPGAYQSSVRDTLVRFGYRALLAVPLLREDQIIGSLSFNRKAPGEFPPEVIDVLKTFATQSALAIQNARLFREIADKSRQLEAASRHKSEFLANMSHELRTPLNAIIGFSEVLTERMFGELNDKQDEYLKDIHASGQHLLSLINDILDLSKIEAGRMELELLDFDLPNAIENALILVRERASRRGIRLGSAIDERLGMIGGDERKVKQVLLNLLSNALKFTPEGGRIDVGASLHDEVVEVSVADTGIGIAPADQDAVFEEFRQVGTADKKAEGTGLGLALSRKFIELHGGRIWVKSQVGMGSTFTFTLPVARGE